MAEQSTPDEIKASVRAEFNAAAPTYDGARAMLIASAPLLAAAALHPGLRVLDVACGTGYIAIPAAQQVAPGGAVTGIDLSPEMVAQTKRKASLQGVTNLDAEVGDAEALAFPDASFDVVTAGLCMQFLPNPEAALAEWKRVLRPGGRLHFSSWGREEQPFGEMLRRHLTSNGLTPQTRAGAFPTVAQCHSMLGDAGFEEVQVVTTSTGFYFRDLDQYWGEIIAGPGATALATATGDVIERVRTGLLAEIATLATPEGIWRDRPVYIASGRKP